MEDGDTVAIGGIITDNTTESVAGVPFLDRLPYYRPRFRARKYYTHQRTELIVFLTPHVIYDTTQITDATEELREESQRPAETLMKVSS